MGQIFLSRSRKDRKENSKKDFVHLVPLWDKKLGVLSVLGVTKYFSQSRKDRKENSKKDFVNLVPLWDKKL